MVRVVIPTGLAKQYANGESQIEVEGERVRDLITNLDARFPGIGQALTEEMAIAIDGEIIQDPLLEKVAEAEEIFFLLQIGGG